LEHLLAARLASLLLLATFCAMPAWCQDLTPRTFWPTPAGIDLVVVGYSYSQGDVLIDRSLPVYGVDSKIHTGSLAYIHTFAFRGRSSNLLLELPYSSGTTRGRVVGLPAQRDFAGFNDAGITWTVNLLGAPAMNADEFRLLRADPRPILGLSLKIVPPTGHYDEERLINVGANRWAARVKLGSILPLRPKWLLELEGSVWFFGDDHEYLSGRREQDPIYAVEAHLIHRFRPGLWLSLNGNYFRGGRQTIGGETREDVQENARFGGTVVLPFGGRNAVKFGYSFGTRTRFGSDFDQFLVTYQRLLR
jgi:hypothetical protein